VPLAVTEVGWQGPTTGGGFSPDARYPASAARRARWLTTLIPALIGSGCGVDAVLSYAWTTTQADPRLGDDWYGLVPPTGGATAGSSALSRALAAAAQQEPSRRSACR
jgi:hypothetical protein